jgi:hypothetical protein
MLAAPGMHPFAVDPHSAVGGLVEAFDEVLDLRPHLFIPHGIGRLVHVPPSSWPAGSGRQRRLLRPDAGTSHVAGHWRKLNPSAELMVGS